MNHNTITRSWAAKSLASLVAGFVLALSLPLAAFAQAASGAAATPPAMATAADVKAAAPAAAPGAVSEEAVDNPYGLKALWNQGDFVAKGTLVIMVIMSMASWYVIFTKLFEQRSMLKSGQEAGEAFWKASSVKQGLGTLKEGTAFHFMAQQGIKANDHHEGTMVEAIDRQTWVSMTMDRAVGSIQSRLQDGMAILATVGSTAPFVGLFGTVWGIYNALVKIGISGQASIDKVAGPVGESLIMTAIGLAVAVPAVMGYNWLIRRNKAIMDQTRAFAGDLHNVLIAGKR
jgi:biopolymer transport protein ExbB